MMKLKTEKNPAWLPEIVKWKSASYDGIKGSPPKWMPKPYIKKFQSAQNILFFAIQDNKGDYKKIKSHFDNMVTEKYYLIVRALMKEKSIYDESLLILREIYKAVLLGKENGLVVLVGEKAAKGDKFCSGGSSKKGKEGELKKSIGIICQSIGSTKFSDVLGVLRDAERCNNFYEHTKHPIGVLFTGVYPNDKCITFMKRGDLPNNQKSIKFKTLSNILSEINKNK